MQEEETTRLRLYVDKARKRFAKRLKKYEALVVEEERYEAAVLVRDMRLNLKRH
jgi:hypothetical protein